MVVLTAGGYLSAGFHSPHFGTAMPPGPSTPFAGPADPHGCALCPGDLAGLRDRALLLLAAAGLDGEQLRSLDREHVHLTDTGSVELQVLHRAVLNAPGQMLALHRTEPVRACPVRALGDWLLVSECRFGPVFRKVDRWGNLEHRRLGADGLRRIWRRRTLAARRRRAAHASS